jgi:hypothetical protein
MFKNSTERAFVLVILMCGFVAFLDLGARCGLWWLASDHAQGQINMRQGEHG